MKSENFSSTLPATAHSHWHISVQLNHPLTEEDGNKWEFALRNSVIGPNGALLRCGLVAIEKTETGLRCRTAYNLNAERFTSPHTITDWCDSVTDIESINRGDRDILPDADGFWPALPDTWSSRGAGSIDLSLLPGTPAWLLQAEDWTRITARRIAREARVIAHGKPPRNGWNPREDEPDPDIRRFVLETAVTTFAILRGRMRAAAKQFLSHLDQDVVTALAVLPAPRLEDYNFYAAAGDVRLKSRRLQALSIYPMLGTALAHPEIAAAIDAGRSLNVAIRRVHGCRPQALKALVGVTPAVTGAASLPDPSTLLTALSSTPAAWLPKNGEDWRAFRRLLDIPKRVAEAGWGASRMRELGPDWRRSVQAIGAWQRLDDLQDFRRALLAHVVEIPFLASVPDWHRTEALPATVPALTDVLRRLLDGRPLLRQLEASDLWHRRQGELARLIGHGSGGRQLYWTPLTDPFIASNGIEITSLVSSQVLRDEGGAMGHCVGSGSYDEMCCYGGRHIVGLREESGDRLSTAELRFDDEGRVSVIQHRAKGNAPPPRRADDALAEYAFGIENGEITCDRNLLAEELERRNATRSGRRSAGFDCSDETVVEEVWRIYRPLLPLPWRRMTAKQFHEESGLAAVAMAEHQMPMDDRWVDAPATDYPTPWERHPELLKEWRALVGARASDGPSEMESALWAAPSVESRPAPLPPPPPAGEYEDDETRLMREWEWGLAAHGPHPAAPEDERIEDILASIRRVLDE